MPLPRHVITLAGQPSQSEQGVAGGVITPGDLVSGTTTVIRHAVAGGDPGPHTFALERQEMGSGIDVNYAVGDRVKVASYAKGDRVYARLNAGQNVAENALLESAGNGTLKIFGTGKVIGKALEAVDATAAIARIRVEVA